MRNRGKTEVISLDSITVNDITIHAKNNESKGTDVYYARIIPNCGICYVQELQVRYIYEDMFSAVDKLTKNAQLLNNSMLGESVFLLRKEANDLVKLAEKSGKIKKVSKEKKTNEED